MHRISFAARGDAVTGGRARGSSAIASACAAAICVLVAGCGGGGSSDGNTTTLPPTPPTPTPPSSSQAVGVSGTQLTLDGAPWLSRGVTLRAFDAPPAYARAQLAEQYKAYTVYQSMAAQEYAAARTYGADTIRFLVSQPGLDPQTTTGLYDAQYASDVISAVKLARSNGFVVMVAIQDEADSGEPATSHQPLATAATQRVLDMLVAAFKDDRGVVFDLYNEPVLPKSAANWALWAAGDPTGTSTVAPGAIGMQSLVTRLRGEGAQNVLVLDGLDHAKTLDGAPQIVDPLGRIAYAIHPYFDGSADESGWDTDYGAPAKLMVVWADEWSANSGSPASGPPLGLGSLPSYQVSVDLVNYLRAHSISLVTGAFDQVPFDVLDVPGWTQTSNYDNYMPGVAGDGSGQLVHVLFTTDYARPLTANDGLR